jgi:uncharacterized membrane protein YozB (DUF420 family)
MSAHHAPDWVPHRSGTGSKDDGILATWLGLLSFTFFYGTFLAANVYLRGWAPDKFTVDFGANADLPALTTICLLVAGFVVLLAGSFFRNNQYKKFQGTMIIAVLAFFGYAVLQMWLLVDAYYLGTAAWTTHLALYSLQFALALIDIIFILLIGKHFAERNEKALRRLVPAAMSVFMYTVLLGILTLVVTDMITVGQFASWCGEKLAAIAK